MALFRLDILALNINIWTNPPSHSNNYDCKKQNLSYPEISLD